MSASKSISASLVKELRERTGVGMMECKRALVDTGGDLEQAVDVLRKSGQAKADNKTGRVAADGLIIALLSEDGQVAVMLEINCETDFVAGDNNFTEFAKRAAETVLFKKLDDVNALGEANMVDSEHTVEQVRKELITKIGENIQIRRVVRMESSNQLAYYLHGKRIGVLVELAGGDKQLGKDIAMHIAASNPIVIEKDDVPQPAIDKEKEIFTAQAQESGKPAEIIEKMIQGRIDKFLDEVSLQGQPFVKDPNTKVGQLLKDKQAQVVRFERFEVGEGIEKQADDFASEVMAQVKGAE
jgi:elongation factor Ts